MDLVNKNVVDLLFLARKILDASGIEDLDEQFKKVIDQTTDIVCNHEIKEYSYSELTELWFKEAGVVGVSFEHQHTPTHTKEFKLNHVYEDNSGNFFLVYDYNGDDDDYLYYSNQNEGGTFRGDLSNKEDLILTGVLTIQDQVLQWRETTFRKYFPVTEVLIGSILAMQQAEHTQELLRFNSYPWRRETLIRVATKSSDSVSLVDFISCVLKIYFPDTIVTSDSEKIDISIHNDSNGIIIKFEKMTDDTFRVLTSDDKEEGKQITFHDQQEIKCIQIKANKMQIEKSEFGMKDFIEKCTEEMRLIFSDSSKTLTLIKNFALVSIARFTDDSITDLIAKCSHTDRGQDRMERTVTAGMGAICKRLDIEYKNEVVRVPETRDWFLATIGQFYFEFRNRNKKVILVRDPEEYVTDSYNLGSGIVHNHMELTITHMFLLRSLPYAQAQAQAQAFVSIEKGFVSITHYMTGNELNEKIRLDNPKARLTKDKDVWSFEYLPDFEIQFCLFKYINLNIEATDVIRSPPPEKKTVVPKGIDRSIPESTLDTKAKEVFQGFGHLFAAATSKINEGKELTILRRAKEAREGVSRITGRITDDVNQRIDRIQRQKEASEERKRIEEASLINFVLTLIEIKK